MGDHSTEPAEARIWVLAERVGSFILQLSGLVLSAVIAWFGYTQHAEAMRASEQQITLQRNALEEQRNARQSTVALATLTHFGCDGTDRRDAAIAVLEIDAPRHLLGLLRALERCPRRGRDAMAELENLQLAASREALRQEFNIRLRGAWTYYEQGHHGPAAREFYEAGQELPVGNYQTELDRAALARANDAYLGGAFKEAADLYARAFAALR